jgi:pseudouridine-5'-phosphate glycosidase/pseudouridine kinase
MAREGKPKENQATILTKAESNIAIPPPISQASIVEEHAEVKLASKKPLVPSKTAGPPAAAISPTGVDILVAGSVAVDTSCNYSPFDKSADASPLPHTSNPAAISRDVGGVGFNVALAAHLTYGANSRAVRLCTLVATDSAGRDIQEHMSRLNLDCSGVKALETSATTRTAQYVAVNDTNKDLCIAMADMGIFSAPRDDFKEQWQPLIDEARPKWIVVDANWHVSTFMQWIAAANAVGAKVAFEPVSVAKSQIIFPDPSTTK